MKEPIPVTEIVSQKDLKMTEYVRILRSAHIFFLLL